MVENLAEAERRIDPETGLFSSPTWNLFDWSGTDINHPIVIHNTMFFIGALLTAGKCAEMLGENERKAHWDSLRRQLAKMVNNYWDSNKQAWPDALMDEGKTPVSTVSVHNCFLSILYDIANAENRDSAKRRSVSPPEDMIKVGSPFAIQYLYETFEKMDMPELIMESFHSAYKPMVKEGATTVWEVFPNARSFDLTRSHCHAWSSSPVYFLDRILLGIKPTEAGGAAFDVSPQINDIDWAEGARATVRGQVKVKWEKIADTLNITATAPDGVSLRYVPNPSHDGMRVTFNDQSI